MMDKVKQVSHYEDGRKHKPKHVIRDWGLNFNLGSAVKYIARAGRKDDIIQDLRKAQEYIQFEIDAIEAERAELKATEDYRYIGCNTCNVVHKCSDAHKPNAIHCGNYNKGLEEAPRCR